MLVNTLEFAYKRIHMSLPAAIVANCFLDLAKAQGVPLTALKLQKLVYYAHGWYLGLTGEPLIIERVEAWPFGPVISSLYQEFKRFGREPILERAPTPDYEKHERAIKAATPLIEKVWQVYSKYTAVQLAALSHANGGPWHKAISQMGDQFVKNFPIPSDSIAEYFKQHLSSGAV
jgi:uncharacterized phage-associated protein